LKFKLQLIPMVEAELSKTHGLSMRHPAGNVGTTKAELVRARATSANEPILMMGNMGKSLACTFSPPTRSFYICISANSLHNK